MSQQIDSGRSTEANSKKYGFFHRKDAWRTCGLDTAESIVALPLKEGAAWFFVLFAGGWVVQLLGHVFEGRKPALVDNLFQIFVAPIFLCAEIFFLLGYKPALHARVQQRALRMRMEAGVTQARTA